ncbi:anaerobic ribonucleoside-triphosphate reductase activating protein [Dysosmobacter sp.]|uniref:anaerobic ribonucleoside-triphosphate reductase activating protein n=1 Tax=Dysosmobacter sp. TaxID=2591382 RepID=UPI003D8E49A9
MRICGLQTLSMVDYPSKLAATVFTGGCNLRCPFCHNALLVTRLEESPTLQQEEVLAFLKRRRGLLDGVVLSGGEPLIQSGVPEFLQKVRSLGFSIKLDTNGCYPDALEALLDQGLADYVAMDVKNAPEHYAQTVGIPDFDPAVITRSAAVLARSGVDYELRTTVVRELHTVADIAAIGAWMQGAPRYFLQCFVDSGALISPGFHAPDRADLENMLQAARPFFGETALRGVD